MKRRHLVGKIWQKRRLVDDAGSLTLMKSIYDCFNARYIKVRGQITGEQVEQRPSRGIDEISAMLSLHMRRSVTYITMPMHSCIQFMGAIMERGPDGISQWKLL